jgi:hypothetical protein
MKPFSLEMFRISAVMTQRKSTTLSLSLILLPTVSRPVRLGIKHPSGAYNKICITVWQLQVCWCGGAVSDERTGLSFTIAAGPRQRSPFRVRLSRDSWPYFSVSDSRLPFSSPPTTRRATVEVFDPRLHTGVSQRRTIFFLSSSIILKHPAYI